MEHLEQENHNGTCCKPCRHNIERMWGCLRSVHGQNKLIIAIVLVIMGVVGSGVAAVLVANWTHITGGG